MTNQEKKEFLNQYQMLNREIDRKLEEQARWRSLACKITPTVSQTPGGGSENRIQAAVEKIYKLEEEINLDIDRLIQLRDEIIKDINAMQDLILRQILLYRYIDGIKWEKVAVDMGYDYRWLLRLHGRALTQLTIESHYKSVI